MRKIAHLAFAVAVATAATCTSAVESRAVESEDPIKFALNDWSSQLINSRIMGSILERAGYNVEYVQADAAAQFAGLQKGDLDVQMEVWSTAQSHLFKEGVESGNLLDLGETGMAAIEEWWYPLYMKEKCPGLPDWQALKSCASLFATAETEPKGRYVGAPPNWGGYDDERVEALDLGFEVIHAGSDAAMYAELESADVRKAPVILWVWAPHWVPSKYEGEWVEFPKYELACYEDPAWGPNPNSKYDCGKPRGPIWKTDWVGLKDKWPGAYEAIKRFQTDNVEQAALITEVEINKRPIEEVVSEWMTKNEPRWKAWIGQ